MSPCATIGGNTHSASSSTVTSLPAPAERSAFARALAADARQITDDDLREPFGYEWRAQLTAAWLAGLDRRERIGELLLASKLCRAGKGFCFALTRSGTQQDAQLPVDCLDRYLARPDLMYDQHWAMAAFLCLDARLGAGHASPFLGPSGAWQRWTAAAATPVTDPGSLRPQIGMMCSFAEHCMRSVDEP
ncbi:DUF6000 family protein [Amycolatopsis dendrobii]|uniref:Uncharacterized protein n=1 Tax=Amycolatopsis dendrobii TaxID=2760662 RepID=A0A7W3W0J0_9PSEU|nr:DUF6000 family protein [Amycolatopsis dendrobii]MBB1156127.1 hypothetical protein [Amycolatopsis dendrobii]